jgi:predicted metal-binding protein
VNIGAGTDMKINEIKRNALSMGIEITDASPPRSTAGSVKIFRTKCEENLCGSYNKSWTCPPAVGTPVECAERLTDFDNAVILVNKYKGVDVNCTETMDKIGSEHEGRCRSVKHLFINAGFEELTLSGGPCTFCGTCLYPDPCPFPEERISSASGYGIDVGEYLRSNGMDFDFKKGEVTLYGIILYR